MLVFSTQLRNCCPSNLLSGPTLFPFPVWISILVYKYTACKGGGYGVLGVRQINTCPFTCQFCRRRHFALPSTILIFLQIGSLLCFLEDLENLVFHQILVELGQFSSFFTSCFVFSYKAQNNFLVGELKFKIFYLFFVIRFYRDAVPLPYKLASLLESVDLFWHFLNLLSALGECAEFSVFGLTRTRLVSNALNEYKKIRVMQRWN